MASFSVNLGRLLVQQQRVAEMAARARDLTVPMVDAARELQDELRDNFDRGVDPFGRRWAPLKKATQARKPRHKNDPLQLTETLQRSVQVRGGPKGLRFGIRSGSQANRYGLVHQFSKRKTLPRRPFLPLTRTGQPDFTRGPMAKFKRRMMRKVRAWILRGERS